MLRRENLKKGGNILSARACMAILYEERLLSVSRNIIYKTEDKNE